MFEEENTLVIGVVSNCVKLNVRDDPDVHGRVMCTINCGTEVEIDLSESVNDWYKVYLVSGVEGYCLNDFITIV